jgi:hypothetical protein
MTIINSSKKIKTLLIITIKTQLTKISHSSKMIKTQLIKMNKTLLTRMIKTRSISCHTQSNMRFQ